MASNGTTYGTYVYYHDKEEDPISTFIVALTDTQIDDADISKYIRFNAAISRTYSVLKDTGVTDVIGELESIMKINALDSARYFDVKAIERLPGGIFNEIMALERRVSDGDKTASAALLDHPAWIKKIRESPQSEEASLA